MADGRAVEGFRFPASYASASKVADAILYEGYLLYPYRKSAAKNRLRWQFGVLAPRGWAERNLPPDDSVAGSAESWFQQAQCLLEAREDAVLSVRLRFLHSQRRDVEELGADGRYRPMSKLEVGGQLLLSFDEATPLERDVEAPLWQLLEGECEFSIEVPGAESATAVHDDDGVLRGRIVRRRRPMQVAIRLSAAPVNAPFPVLQLTTRVENHTGGLAADAPREEAVGKSLLATHCFFGVSRGRFLSLVDPPQWAAVAAASCANVHVFPVLAGDDGEQSLTLASPIILYDYPRIAPESPGDLFDAGEIDEILSLRTLTLTEAEKREARATDPRAADIVDRVEASAPDVFAALHGTFRASAAATSDDEPEPLDWWEPGADAQVSPDTDTVLVGGVRIGKGSRVRLHPRAHGTDLHDMFLAGRYARVHAVLTDVDDQRFVAVQVEDDPAAEMHAALGRFFHFTPDEVEPADSQP